MLFLVLFFLKKLTKLCSIKVGVNVGRWATDAEGQRHEFGNPNPNPKTSNKWRNINTW